MAAVNLFLALALCWGAPGYLGLLWWECGRARTPLLGRIVLGSALSVALAGFVGLLLAAVHLLTRAGIFGSLAVLTVVPAAGYVLRRRQLGLGRPQLPRLDAGRAGTLAWVALCLGLVLAPRVYVAVSSPAAPLEPDSWVYVADTVRLASTHSIGTEISQWGLRTRFPTDKITFELASAAFMLISGLDYLLTMKVITLLYVAGGALGCWLLARELVAPALATAASVALFFDVRWGIGIFSNRAGLTFFRSEGFAITLGLAALWAASRGVLRGERRGLVIAALLLPFVFMSHAVTGVVVALLIASMFAGRWIARRRIAGREVLSLGLIGSTALVGTVLIYAVTGTGPLFGNSVVDAAAYQTFGTTDPTHELRVRLTGIEDLEPAVLHPKSEQRFYISPLDIGRQLVARSFPADIGAPWYLVVGAGFTTLLVALMLARRVPERRRTAAAGFLVFFAALYLLALAFSFRYTTAGMATHPVAREFPYATLVLLLAGAVLLQTAVDAARARWPHSIVGRAAGPAVYSAAGLFVVWYCLLPGVQAFLTTADNRLDLDADGIAALAWLGQHSQPDDIILTNVRTAGAIEVIAGREGLTEGRGVYQRPDLIGDVLGLIDGTVRFYHLPLYVDVLRKHDVAYVVAAPAQSIGGRVPLADNVDLHFLEETPFLRPVATFGAVEILAVEPLPAYTPDVAAGFAQLAGDDREAALGSFTRAATQSPADPWAWLGLGLVQEARGADAEAIAAYRTAAASPAVEPLASLRLARRYVARGEFAPAAAAYEVALGVRSDVDVLADLADVYRLMGQMDEARSRYGAVLALAPERMEARAGLCRLTLPVNLSEEQGAAVCDIAVGLAGQLPPGAGQLDVAAVAALLGPRPAADAGNLIRNPTLTEGNLDGWKQFSGEGVGVRVRLEALAGGTGDSITTISSAAAGYQGGLCQSLPVEPGQKYLYVTSAEGEPAVDARVQVAYWDYRRFGFMQGKPGPTFTEPFPRKTQWRVVEAPAGVRSISVCPVLLYGPGTARFDRVAFVPLSKLLAGGSAKK